MRGVPISHADQCSVSTHPSQTLFWGQTVVETTAWTLRQVASLAPKNPGESVGIGDGCIDSSQSYT